MNTNINPFQQLYFSDDTQTEDTFVALFSDKVLQTAIHPVFQGGNVVLCGTQGCGKTMILNLLRPEIRLAYSKCDRRSEFPVPKEMRCFVSAGINLTRSGITDLVQVTLGKDEDTDARELPRYFADFFNYLVVDDLLNSVKLIGAHPQVFDSLVDLSNIKSFVSCIAEQDCWFGSLASATTLPELQQLISSRIQFYRGWVNGNHTHTEPPREIRTQKSGIGEPIARMAECLRKQGVVREDVPVLIRVDQIEEMHRAFTDRQRRLLLEFRRTINRAFARRDARIHYRGGARPYGWNNPEFLTIAGSAARLENRRDYLLIDMDEELFARRETPNSIFEPFALDAFQKRIGYFFKVEEGQLRPTLAKSVFGKHPSPTERLGALSEDPSDAQIDKALALDVAADTLEWSQGWRIFLRNLYRTGHAGMLDAALATAWGRQTGGANKKREHRESPPPDEAPWRDRKWWRKERTDLAVLQLMVRNQQRFIWWGYKDICSLSGGNITVFLHICHRIWDGFLKSESTKPENERTDLLKGATIDRNIQAAGVLFASNEWFKKLPEEPGGHSRQSFVEQLGVRLNEDMMRDLRMAYPGGNGISVPSAKYLSEDDDVSALRNFIRESVGFGVFVEIEHSSKSRSQGRRTKFYFNPILCPRFQIPEARTKEPYYWTLSELFALAKKANVTLVRSRRDRTDSHFSEAVLPGVEEFFE